MSKFAAHLSRCPRPFDPDRGAEALGHLPELAPELADLVKGAAGTSPYLAGLVSREAEWLGTALDGTAEAALDDALTVDPEGLHSGLRQAKRRVALLTALADLGGVWPLEKVTAALTRFADLATDLALRHFLSAEIRRGKVAGLDRDADPVETGVVALAMGKMGAGELNYSSDIDLICLFDESRHDPDDYFEVRTALVRATRNAMQMLSKADEGGYVFRTDLRLRPDPASTPVCMTMEAAERYYESLGRTWERAAYIKARAAAGDIAAGEGFLERLTPFVWRKHLDFAAIQDAHDMRLRIRDHKGLGGARTLAGRNLKLAPGGIREIEFFTQTRQLIAGGRDPELRVRGTCDGLDRLSAAGWLPEDVAATLKTAYRAHREVEHRLQMINDAQTHDLPASDVGFGRLAALMDRDVEDLKAELWDRIETVEDIAEAFFQPGDDAETDKEPELGEEAQEIVANWRNYPALRSERAQTIFDRLRPMILERLVQTAQPDRTLAHLDGFLRGLPAGVQLFSLFEANPQLIDLIIDIADSAPELATYLSRNAGVFDAVIGGTFFEDWPGRAALIDELNRKLAEAEDYESRLDATRAWTKEQHFRIGVHHLRGLIDAQEAGRQYADLAGAVLCGLWPMVVEEFAAKHGAPPGRGAAILGMGSLGAERLNAASDLDLIVIYDADGAEASEGPRPLSARPYYARLTQALVTAISAPMAEGRLYEVDMRLRPSGRQGPVATSLGAFRSYQREEAWTWEHLALTRARPVAGVADLIDEIEGFRRDLIGTAHDAAKIAADTADMRARLAEARPGTGGLDVKTGAGRLQDIDLLASMLALLAGAADQDPARQIAAGAGAGLIDPDEADRLAAIAAAQWRVQAAARLLAPAGLDSAALGPGGRALLLRGSDETSLEALAEAQNRMADDAADIISRAIAAHSE